MQKIQNSYIIHSILSMRKPCYISFSQCMHTFYYVHLQAKYTLEVNTLKNSPYFEKTNRENGYFSTHFLTAYQYILFEQVIKLRWLLRTLKALDIPTMSHFYITYLVSRRTGSKWVSYLNFIIGYIAMEVLVTYQNASKELSKIPYTFFLTTNTW